MQLDAPLKVRLILLIVATLASPLALIAVLQLVKEKGKFSLLSLLTAASNAMN